MKIEQIVEILSRPMNMKDVPADILEAHKKAVIAVESFGKMKREMDGCLNTGNGFMYDCGVIDCMDILNKYYCEVEDD